MSEGQSKATQKTQNTYLLHIGLQLLRDSADLHSGECLILQVHTGERHEL
jgi:hypothetical protein